MERMTIWEDSIIMNSKRETAKRKLKKKKEDMSDAKDMIPNLMADAFLMSTKDNLRIHKVISPKEYFASDTSKWSELKDVNMQIFLAMFFGAIILLILDALVLIHFYM